LDKKSPLLLQKANMRH